MLWLPPAALPWRRAFAARLETGAVPAALSYLPEKLYSRLAARRIARPLTLPARANIVGIGSAVLGGAGKTPTCIAWALALARTGARVAVVAHGYRARTSIVRRVEPSAPVAQVGDDSLVLARALAPFGVPVWVGPDRSATLDQAAASADVVLIDGLLQSCPRRLDHAVLVLDASAPWGSGHCLPRGDLRAPPEALRAASDELVVVTDPERDGAGLCPELSAVRRATLRMEGFSERAGMRSLEQARNARLGLLLLVARPQRIRSSLACRGIRLACEWLGADHHPPTTRELLQLERLARRHRLDAWLVTPKCRTHLSSEPGAPLWTIETRVRLDPNL